MQSRYLDTMNKLNIKERTVAITLGNLFLLLGLAGFVPGLTAMPAVAAEGPMRVADLAFSDGYGNVFGLFPTNYFHNAVRIVVGIWGIAASTSLGGALSYNRAIAILYTLITFMGLLPPTYTFFGLMPISGNDVWLNALVSILAGYAGFLRPTNFESAGSPTASA